MAWFDPLVRPELTQIHAYRPADIPPGAARLDANECSVPLDATSRARLAEELAKVDLHRYPDVRARRLREQIAESVHAHPDEIVIGCGSDEVITLLLGALGRAREGGRPAAVMYPDPTFVMFRISALAHGLRPTPVPLDAHWDLDVAAMRDVVQREQPNVLFLPSPNNPTGNCFERSRVQQLVDATRDSTLVIMDEAYGAFSGTRYDDLRTEHSHVGQLQTLSKIGLAGARVGWAILPREIAGLVERVRQPYNLNALSQRAAELVLGELAPAFSRAVDAIITQRERLRDLLGAVAGVAVAPSAANFLWITVPRDAADVYAALAERGVFVRSFHAAGERFRFQLRVTVGTESENDRFVEALRASI